ncbi:Atrial natriuretic peptide-converting enzyme [Halotydeus destructor]|nr:Atrial natriuretic peptide-converting enzyme [Halotydeus destructor]
MCRKGMILPIFHEEKEEIWLSKNHVRHYFDFWLGLRNEIYSSNYTQWYDGTPLNYTAWDQDRIPYKAYECSGVYVEKQDGNWTDCACDGCKDTRIICMKQKKMADMDVAVNNITFEGLNCLKQELQCANGKKCIWYDYLCDGDDNCGDNSDEQDCDANAEIKKTPSGEYVVEYKYIIPGLNPKQSLIETNCKTHQFTCFDGQCVPLAARCDKKADCADGTDEDICEYNYQKSPVSQLYYMIKAPMNYFQAHKTCKRLGGTLPMPTSKEESDWIGGLVNRPFWIDARNTPGTVYFPKFRNGTDITYTNWGVTQPNNDNQECTAIAVHGGGKWFDCRCSDCDWKLAICVRNFRYQKDSNETESGEKDGEKTSDDLRHGVGWTGARYGQSFLWLIVALVAAAILLYFILDFAGTKKVTYKVDP